MHSGNKIEELKSVLQGRKEAELQKKKEATEEGDKKREELELKLRETEENLKKAEETARENQDKYVRLYAEFENYRKRVLKDKEDLKYSSEEKIIREILPLLDDLQLALKHAEQSTDLNALLEGMRLIQKQTQTTIEKLGIEAFASAGYAFDPHIHEAVAHQESDQHPANTVIQEYRSGYKFKGKLLRPSMVVVAK
ncbi:MAG: nucleotide exchange factor GrpE [Deltaproteobacteria bacterium]|nr:nucleotide exchange factor GrpE [Deltaproteobacteria bacterium]